MSESLNAVELITPPNPSIADEASLSGGTTHVSLKTVKAAMLDFTSKRVLMLALTLLCVVAFANSVTGDFVRDDTQQIAGNPMLGHWDGVTLKRALTRDFWAGVQPDLAGDKLNSIYYRPVFTLFLMLAYEVAGLHPPLWHLIVILLQSLCAVLAFVILDKTLQQATALDDRPRHLLAATAAALFAIHPVQAESVAWIAGLIDPLSAIFMLAAFYCYLSYKQRQQIRALIGMMLWSALAMLTKESTILLVAIVFAHELLVFNIDTPVSRRLWQAVKYALPFAIIGLGYMILRYLVLGVWLGRNLNLNFPDDAGLTVADMMRTWPALLVAYGKLLVFPFDLSLLYGLGYVKTMGWTNFWLPLLALVAIAATLLKLGKRHAVVRLAGIWLILPLLPHLNTRAFVSDEIIHDRYLYLSLLGVGLLVGALLVSTGWQPKWFSTRARRAVMAGLLALLMLGTWGTNRRFQNNEVAWADSIAHAPNIRSSLLAAGLHAESIGDNAGALRVYEQALAIHPDILDALNNSAFIYARSGQWDKAISRFERITALTPDRAISHFNLSFAYAVERRYADAIREQQLALDLDPQNPRAGEWRGRLDELRQRLTMSGTGRP